MAAVSRNAAGLNGAPSAAPGGAPMAMPYPFIPMQFAAAPIVAHHLIDGMPGRFPEPGISERAPHVDELLLSPPAQQAVSIG